MKFGERIWIQEDGGDFVSFTVKEAHELHDKLTVFINNNPLPDNE